LPAQGADPTLRESAVEAAMAKTKQTDDDVGAFLAAVENPQRREDSHRLVELMSRITGEPPKLWGTIVGFGKYHYKYASGHEGDSALVGFSPRKAEFSIYLTGTYFPGQDKARAALLAKLGKHRIGKACLYVKKLDDIDLGVLEQLVKMSVDGLREHYPAT
jgi:hypothetical protein